MQLTTNYKLKKPDGTDVVNVQDFNDNADILDNALATHTHSTSQITGMPSALKNPNALTIQLNGSSQGAYDGSSAKTINITKSSIGLGNVDNVSKAQILASPALTGVPTAPTATAGTNTTQVATTAFVTTAVNNKTSVSGNAGTATKLQTARTINGVAFDGSSNISINSMSTGSNITLHADSDSSSTSEYISMRAGGNELKIVSSGGGSSPAKNNNNLTFNGNVIYHAGKKPTPADIGASATGHTHDDRYYTESEINSKINTINNNINGKANSNHTHDDRYYTEAEINTKLNGKSDTSHTHSQYARRDGAVANAGDTPLNGNIDSIETIGRYRINGTSCTGLPNQLTGDILQHSILEVTNIGNGLIQQRLIPTNNTAYPQLVQSEFTRVRSFDSGWTPWREIAHTKTVEVTALNGWYFGFKWNNDMYVPSCTLVGNTCTFTATLTAGTVSNGTAICKLPVPAYRTWTHMHCQSSQTYPAPLYLTPDGYLNAGDTGLVKDRVYAISFSYMVARGQNV